MDKFGLIKHDVSETAQLIREDDHVVYGDSGYLGAPERPEINNEKNLSQVEFRINNWPSSLKIADNFKGMNWDKKWNTKICIASTHYSPVLT